MKEIKIEAVKSKTTFEDILQNSGGFGRFQFLILVGLLIAEIPAAFVAFAPVFVGLTPDSWNCDNVTVSGSGICQCPGNLVHTDYSIVSEWGLVCESGWVPGFITSIQMFGMLLGSLFSSQISDWYGRKWVYLGVCLFMAGGQLLSALAPNPIFYALARFIAGAGISGFMGMSTIYPLEFMTSDWRVLIGSVGPWGEGIMIFAILAYLIQPWRELLLYSSLPFLLVVSILPWIPESPRYLLRNGRIDETVEVINLIQKVNRKYDLSVSYELLDEIRKDENVGQVSGSRFSYLDFFREKSLRNKTLTLMGIWFSWSLVYFGISYNITTLPGNIYFNVFLMGLADAFGYPASLLINNKLGRRKSLVIFMSLGAIFLVTLALLDLIYGSSGVSSETVIFLCLSGKFGMAGARSAARVLTGESFPTPIRTMGYGISGLTAGIAGIIAPQISYFGALWWSPLPFVTFGVMSVGGSLLSLLLPETAGKGLEERLIPLTSVPTNYYTSQDTVRGKELQII